MATASLPINTDTILILENGWESCHFQQTCTEHLNVIEQLLVSIVEQLNSDYPSLRSQFIVRRLPAFTVPYFTKTEYAVVLDCQDFTLTPNLPVSDSASIDAGKPKVNLGHTEIYKRTEPGVEACRSQDSNGKPYGSHEFFERFSAAFVKTFGIVTDRETEPDLDRSVNRVQILGSHILHAVKGNPEVHKIFTLEPSENLSFKKKSRCKLQVIHETSVLIIDLEGIEAFVRPGIFLRNGFPKIQNAILERIPLYHPSILNIGESLLKGCLLTPTSCENQWTIQFWPAESHLLFRFHPNSIVCRVFKLYGCFCLNPVNFWENLNSCFLIGGEEMESLCQHVGLKSLPIDFVLSTFLKELEDLPEITDWAPNNFSARLTSLLAQAVQAYDKGFHSHYFTKRNVLRNLWKTRSLVGNLNVATGLHHIDSVRSASVPPVVVNDEFGLYFDELSVNEREDSVRDHEPVSRKITVDSTLSSKESKTSRESRSLSKYIGASLLRRFSMGTGLTEDRNTSARQQNNRSLTDIATGFESLVNQQRRNQIRARSGSLDRRGQSDDVFSSSAVFAETSFTKVTNLPVISTGNVNEACDHKDSIYTVVLQLLNEISPSNYLSNMELITHLDNCRRVMGSQGEVIKAWTEVLKEFPRPRYICPHAFSPRQLQSISLVMKTLAKCTCTIGSDASANPGGKPPAWEIIGEILRIALFQMRADGSRRESVKERKRSGFSFQGFRPSDGAAAGGTRLSSRSGTTVSKFSFRTVDICKNHVDLGAVDVDGETVMTMEDPETAATHRLLQWLWQLRNSEVGRLSRRAQKFMESLHTSSLIQSHFLEQFTEIRTVETMALRSAVAVSRIMADDKYPPHVPLMTAAKRGWQWSDTVLSFASWTEQRGSVMQARIPLVNSSSNVIRDVRLNTLSSGPTGGQLTLKRIHNPTEPDTESLNLAFHSECAKPLGVCEEPLFQGSIKANLLDIKVRNLVGPYAVPVLIYTAGYFNQWEVSPGNIVHALVRLQKFIVSRYL